MTAPSPRHAPRHPLGLVVGTLSPLHRGHEWLVGQAAAACETVLVLSYSAPEFPGCDAATRQRWMQACLAAPHAHVECLALDAAGLRTRCAERNLPLRPMPLNDAPDADQQAWLAWLLRDVLGLQPDALFTSEAYGPPCAQTLSRAFGKPVVSVQGDPARQVVPISATRIRQDPAAHRVWLSPVVWADFVPRVVLLGGESSGKTTLARALAQALRTTWVPEYGRELWEQQGGHLDEADLLRIAREQACREDRAAGHARTHLVCDTSPLATLGYSLWMFGQAAAELEALARRPYALSVLCVPDIPFVQDGTRRDADFRLQQHAWYVRQLDRWPGRVEVVRGGVAERVAAVSKALGTR
jgi:HTH-type transcriptional repressor of NAD biosynthesis genes